MQAGFARRARAIKQASLDVRSIVGGSGATVILLLNGELEVDRVVKVAARRERFQTGGGEFVD